MNTVTFLLMRHSEHKDGVVTPEGEARIAAAAQELLPQFGTLDFALCTEKKRARRTAFLASEAINQAFSNDEIVVDPLLGFGYLEEEDWINEKYPWDEALKKIADTRATGQPATVRQVCENLWPPALVVRHTLQARLNYWAERVYQTSQKTNINVLVGNHATNVCATLTPEKTDGYPPYCAVMVYHYRLEVQTRTNSTGHFQSTLISSDLLIPSDPMWD